MPPSLCLPSARLAEAESLTWRRSVFSPSATRVASKTLRRSSFFFRARTGANASARRAILLEPAFTWTITTDKLRVKALGTIFDDVTLTKDVNFSGQSFALSLWRFPLTPLPEQPLTDSLEVWLYVLGFLRALLITYNLQSPSSTPTSPATLPTESSSSPTPPSPVLRTLVSSSATSALWPASWEK